jgi:hypothetical protein
VVPPGDPQRQEHHPNDKECADNIKLVAEKWPKNEADKEHN